MNKFGGGKASLQTTQAYIVSFAMVFLCHGLSMGACLFKD